MRLFLLLFICVISVSSAQTFDETLEAIVKTESRVGSNALYNRFGANSNTGNYDVIYHNLEFNIDPNVAFISGVVTTQFIAQSAMTEITFDLTSNMVVSGVTQNGTPLTFSQNNNDELIITLNQTLNANQTGEVIISYSGNPVSSGFGSFEQTTHNGDPVIWTLSEPYGAKGWWPCKQDLNDKIESIDVYITTPTNNPSNEEYIAVSNGLEQSQTYNGANKTTHYKHLYPIPAYLVAIAITNYEVYSHTVPNNGNPFDIINYVYPESLASAQASTAITVDIMNLFSNTFETYPFENEKYGHAQFGWGGGMEHTTVSFMGNFSRGLIAHELAHQWFGDKITCGSWKDIWLNEGFATYLSGLVIEDFDGNTSFKSWKQQRINSITSQTNGAVYLTDTDTTSVNRIFNSRLTYNKGAMVLHMLRKKVGDISFYQGVQNYLNDTNLAYNYAKTPDFVTIMETESGEDLTEFFNDWLYNQGYPSYNVTWYQSNTNQFEVKLDQNQSDASVSFFEAPVHLRLLGDNLEELDLIIDNTTNNQIYTELINFNIASVEFNPEYDLISKNNSVSQSTVSLSTPNFNYLPITFYPNPAKNILNIQCNDLNDISKIEIYDILGRLVLQPEVSSLITINSLASGVHFVKFYTLSGSIIKPLIKK